MTDNKHFLSTSFHWHLERIHFFGIFQRFSFPLRQMARQTSKRWQKANISAAHHTLAIFNLCFSSAPSWESVRKRLTSHTRFHICSRYNKLRVTDNSSHTTSLCLGIFTFFSVHIFSFDISLAFASDEYGDETERRNEKWKKSMNSQMMI